MTSKATLLSLDRLTLAGLVECDLPRAPAKRIRRIFVTQEINDLIAGKVSSNPEFPCADADFELGKFVKGHIVGVSRKHSGRAELKWMTGVPESWVFCFRKPKPGWRLFGRFVRKNVFVGLHCVPREEAGDLIQYANQAKKMSQMWIKYFPNEIPFLGHTFEEYLGEMVIER